MKTIKHIEHIFSKSKKIYFKPIQHCLLSKEKVELDGRIIVQSKFKKNVNVNTELSVSDFSLENVLELDVKLNPVSLTQSKTTMADNIVDTFQRAEEHYNKL